MGYLGQLPLPQLHEHYIKVGKITFLGSSYTGVETGEQQSRRGMHTTLT